MSPNSRKRPFTGWHMSLILVAFFVTVFAVNMTMARLASSTFGGVVVENSYVASQHFNRWLDDAERQQALGWSVAAARQSDNRIGLSLDGVPSGASITAVARHPLGQLPDEMLAFTPAGEGRQVSEGSLPEGRWTLRVIVQADGETWRTELPLS